MRKYTILIILATLANVAIAQKKFKVVATASMIADMARNIAGDNLEIECIVPIGGDPHLHEPTPGDARMVSSADIILMNGLTFEGWLTELINNSGTKANTVLVTKGIQPIESLTYANSTDPHAWMAASNGLVYIENIKNAFINLDVKNQSSYEANYTAYKQRLEDLDAYIVEKIKTIPEKRRILITSHDAFQYYGRRYGIQLEAILGTSTDADIQTSDIIRLNKVIRENEVPALFIESTVNPKTLKQLASDNNISIGGELYADSIGDEDSPAPSYYDMLKYNTDTIVKALTQTVNANEETSKGESTGDKTNTNIFLYALVGLLFLGGFFFVFKKLNK